MTRNDPPFPADLLRRLCEVLGDTDRGLTGSEIGRLLAQRRLADPGEGITKRERLYTALANAQARFQNGVPVLNFVRDAMAPVSYTGARHGLFHDRRARVNEVLCFYGLEVREDGKFGRVTAARTVSEAAARTARLRSELERRGVHADVLRYCSEELLQNNCFHAVFEATKSVADKIRLRTGLQTDGTSLVDAAFSGSTPMLIINDYRSETEQSEQRGFTNLLKGLFGTFRNVTAHAPKVQWPMAEDDALDLFSLASYVHRRLRRTHPDKARAARLLADKYRLPDVSNSLSELNSARKAMAYGDTVFPQLDAQDVASEVEQYVDAVAALLETDEEE